MIKVVKFGGSSLADAVQIKKAGKIVLSEESRRYVVPSAPGKRFSADTKVTEINNIRKTKYTKSPNFPTKTKISPMNREILQIVFIFYPHLCLKLRTNHE